MVCVPCIILPVLLAIYLKFIQPFILRYLPQSWVTFLDPILYPTCPLKLDTPAPESEEKAEDKTESCCDSNSKKDQ